MKDQITAARGCHRLELGCMGLKGVMAAEHRVDWACETNGSEIVEGGVGEILSIPLYADVKDSRSARG